MKTLLKGGTVVSAGGSAKRDVLIDGEKIEQVAETITCDLTRRQTSST